MHTQTHPATYKVSRESMFLGSLSRDNKDLEQGTLKPSACHSSWVLDKLCYSSQANQCYSSIFIQKIAGERERACARARTQQRESVRKRFGSFFYVFSSTWACPMQTGLSQECCLFCLKSSLWSLDLPLTFLVFQPPPFWTPCPYSTYLTQPSHLLLPSSPLAFSHSQHQDVFQ